MNASRARLATALLVLPTVFWGSTFPMVKEACTAIRDGLGMTPLGAALFFFTLRFLLAAAAFGVAFHRSPRMWKPRSALYGLGLAAPTMPAFTLQFFGLAGDTDPAVSAFFTGLFVVFVPVVEFVLARKRPGGLFIFGVLLSVAGIALVGRLDHGLGAVGPGEWATLGAALLFGIQISLTDRFTRRAPPVAITFWMLLFMGLGGAATSAAVSGPEALLAARSWEVVLGDVRVWGAIAFTAAFATVMAQYIMNSFQMAVSPVRAGLIYSLEPVWAGVFSALFTDERFGTMKVLGFSLLVIANVIVEVGPRLRRVRARSNSASRPR